MATITTRKPLGAVRNALPGLLFLLVSIGLLYGQSDKSSDSKADQSLKGSTRVNPSTLAMEFSLPLGVYPGRAGNALPLTITYSSKVWSASIINTEYTDTTISNPQNPPYPRVINEYKTAVFSYAHKENAGWNASLQPPRIIQSDSFFLERPDTGPNATAASVLEQEIQFPEDVSYNLEHNFESMFIVETDCHSFINRNGKLCRVCWAGAPGPSQPQIDIVVNCWEPNTPAPGNTGGPRSSGTGTNTAVASMVKRIKIEMPDGSVVEFRKDDIRFQCGFLSSGNQNCAINLAGTYLSVDGSRMRLEYRQLHNGQLRNVLYMPDGSRYIFPLSGSLESNPRFSEAGEFYDANGNQKTYDRSTGFWTDTLGAQIRNPFPTRLPGEHTPSSENTQVLNVPALPGAPRQAQLAWKRLKAVGCETDTTGSCGESALEDPTAALRFVGSDTASADNVNAPALFTGLQWSDQQTGIIRNFKLNVSGTEYVNGSPVRFNPVVLKEAIMPDGSKYQFRYNIYGEISRITYPTGVVERFTYAAIPPMGYSMGPIYDKVNRGVLERKVYENEQAVVNSTPTQVWSYQATDASSGYEVTITAPDLSRTESLIHRTRDHGYGFVNSMNGRPFDEKVFSAPVGGVSRLVSRTLTDWKQDGPLPNGYLDASRDPRPERTMSIVFENGKALATMSEISYETPGENGSTAPDDRSYFARLNARQTKSYHFLPLNVSDAEDLPLSTLKGQFHQNGQVASISQTDYLYDADLRARGIIGLPQESRSLNPLNPSDVLAKSLFIYDETAYFDNNYTTTNWVDPNSALRGNLTTTRTWVKESNTWLDSHTSYDNFGNPRKVWDASGDTTKFVETQYDPAYKYAYPTKVITPAPDPTNTTGTNQTSTGETTYDLSTGLPLTVKDDFGQITGTEYDLMLRPTRVFAVNFTAPEMLTIYGDPDSSGHFPEAERFVKTRKQIDATNWDEATVWADALGRTIKTQAKDSQGDVFVETVYDAFGRLERVSNPYRAGDTVYWSKTRYDAAGRAVETYAPATLAEITANNLTSLGTTAFDISNVTNYTGSVVTTMDASERKGRSITNALGQLIRVDEPTAIGGTETADLGSLATPHQPTFYKYSPQGKMVHMQQGVQNRYFLYDSLGRLLRVRQPEQDVNTSLNLSDPITGNSLWTAGFTYDIFGNVLTATDANGTVITNSYDRAHRVKTRAYSNEPAGVTTPTVNFFYDGIGLAQPQTPNYAKGKLTKVDNGISSTEYMTFDNFGRVTRSKQTTDGIEYGGGTDESRWMTYSYNLSGALVEERYPSGRVVKNEFESDGDLARIYGRANLGSTEVTYANSFAYTPDGRIESLKLGNHLWEKAKFNSRLQVTELALGHGPGSGDLWKLGYEYGELNTDGSVNTAKNTGNIAKTTLSFNGLPHPFVQAFKYDALFRLTEARETNNGGQTWKQTFGFDRYGNRTAFTQDIGGQQLQLTNLTLPSIDPNTNRFQPSQGYSFDKNGNLTNDPVGGNRQFTFNGDNKQSEVRDASGALIGKYFFDGEGRRIKKDLYSGGVVTETTVFVYSNGKLIAEYSTAPPPQSPTTNYTVTDQLGSPRVIVNAWGQVTSRRDFMPFGEELAPDANNRTTGLKYGAVDNVRQKFTGYQKDDETALDFAQARMYENRHGRFTAVDPLLASGKSADPQTLNRYVYVLGNPLRFTDPTGLQASQTVYECDRGRAGCDYTLTGGDTLRLNNRDLASTTTFGAFELLETSRPALTTDVMSRPLEPTDVLLDSFKGAYEDTQSGSSKGAINFFKGMWNFGTDAIVNRGTPMFGISSNPFALEPEPIFSATEARYSFGVQLGLSLAPSAAAAPFSASSSLSVFSAARATTVPNGAFYSVAFETKLPRSHYPGGSYWQHFKHANTMLDGAISTDSSLATGMSQLGISVPRSASGSILGRSPSGWVWHHAEARGVLQLVPKSQHPSVPGGIFWNTMHPGGIGGMRRWNQ